jgi:hypothetical protein
VVLGRTLLVHYVIVSKWHKLSLIQRKPFLVPADLLRGKFISYKFKLLCVLAMFCEGDSSINFHSNLERAYLPCYFAFIIGLNHSCTSDANTSNVVKHLLNLALEEIRYLPVQRSIALCVFHVITTQYSLSL